MRVDERRSRGAWFSIRVGVLLWALVALATWPSALTFIDEAGYAGQARMALDGMFRPLETSPCIYLPTDQGLLAKYPLTLPLAIAPLFAVHPSVSFLLGFFAAASLTIGLAKTLESRGIRPAWGLLVLVHPAVQLLSKTLMADLLLSVGLFFAWQAMQKNRRGAMLWMSALVVAIKPTGIPLIAAMIAGEAVARLRSARSLQPVLWPILGAGIGLFSVVGFNLLATGTPWYAYQWAHDHVEQFSPSHFLTSSPAHLRTLLLLPPGLVLGAFFLWRRRDYGPLCAALAHFVWMSGYYYVDAGSNLIESMLVGARLMLPAIVLLFVGYSELLASVFDRVRLTKAIGWMLLLAVAVMSLGIGVAQQRLHRPLREARVAAERLADQHDGRIGTTFDALKAAALSSREVVYWSGADPSVCVLLCNTVSFSRQLDRRPSCDFDGFRQQEQIGTFRILIREECTAADHGDEP